MWTNKGIEPRSTVRDHYARSVTGFLASSHFVNCLGQQQQTAGVHRHPRSSSGNERRLLEDGVGTEQQEHSDGDADR